MLGSIQRFLINLIINSKLAIVLLVETRLFHRITRKSFQGLLCERFGCSKMGCSCGRLSLVSNFPSPSIPSWTKPNHALSKAETNARVQSFRFIFTA